MNNTNLYKPGPGIASDVIKEVKPIYLGLTKADDLAKCLHGLTQNANESFNYDLGTNPKTFIMWNKLAKTRCV